MGLLRRGPSTDNNNNKSNLLRSLPICLLTSVLVITIFITTSELFSSSSSSLSSFSTGADSTKKVNTNDNNALGGAPCDPAIIYRGPSGLPPLKNRNYLGDLLEARQLQHGAEVGVQQGLFSREILRRWPSCQSFTLIDLWAQQANYVDFANVADNVQEKIYQTALAKTAEFGPKVKVLRMLSTEAAKQMDDHSLDFVYIDARHDYCGVLEDLMAYWPKLRPGGIMAGHDFMTTAEVKKVTPDQDWSICHDGSVHESAVKGAVEYFAEQQGLVISVMYDENARFPSWMVQKPTRPECIPTNNATATSPALFTIKST